MAEPSDAEVEAALEAEREVLYHQPMETMFGVTYKAMRAALVAASAVRDRAAALSELARVDGGQIELEHREALKRAIVAGMDEPGSSE